MAGLREACGEGRGGLEEGERLWSQRAEDASLRGGLEPAASLQQAQLLREEAGVAEERMKGLTGLLQAAREELGRSEEALASERAMTIRLEADVRALPGELRLVKGLGAGRSGGEEAGGAAARPLYTSHCPGE